jgi:thioester reductase-like protein
MTTYFITGATGVLGSAIIRELLRQPLHRLILLIRAKDDAALQTRVEQLLAFLNVDSSVAKERIEAVRGDTELIRFGLDAREYSMLCASVTHIIHSAAIVRMNLPLDTARQASVASADNILQLARLCQANGILRKAEMVSTVGVGGRWSGPLPERWIDESRRFHNTYEQAKAEAETGIQRAIKDGLPVTVHRPSMIVGNSRDGSIPHFQIFYHLIEFIAGRRTLGMLPDLGRHHVDLVPADYVAQAIIWSSLDNVTTGRVLHLCSGPDHALPLKKLRTAVMEQFSRHRVSVPTGRTLPIAWFNAFARAAAPLVPKQFRRALATLPIFLDYLSEDQEFANIQTRQLLEPAGLILPEADTFLRPVLDYYLERTYPR